MIVSGTIKGIGFAVADGYLSCGLVVAGVVVKVQVNGLVAALAGDGVELVGSDSSVWRTVPMVDIIWASLALAATRREKAISGNRSPVTSA